ncbi:uncharacterized protein LOC101845277 isoform X2 [Aplysia californica]|nr:uncharacterized protein LOC101845277 isoform X2 [Aplysia californica]
MALSQSESLKFAEELAWCIDQLELGLQRQNPDSRQAAETVKILKILRSTKAPMVKKRQAMRNALGDYRKKMREAEKKSLSGMRHSQFVSSAGKGAHTGSRFLRHSHKQQSSHDLNANLNSLHIEDSEHCPPDSTSLAVNSNRSFHENEQIKENLPSTSGEPDPQENDLAAAVIGQTFHFVRSDNSFCFGFEDPNVSDGKSAEKIEDLGSENIVDEEKTISAMSSKNFYKLEKSENDFCFNFGGS